MGLVIAASLAFGVGGAFMKASDGFSRLWPSAAVATLFIVGSVLLARAVRAQGLSTAYLLGLGIEAGVSIGLGRLVFDERLSLHQALGVVLILGGVAGVRYG